MTIEKHQEEVSKLKGVEDELIDLIVATGDDTLAEKFIQWQNQRNVCNEGFLKLAENVS